MDESLWISTVLAAGPQLHRAARRIVEDDALAEDAVAETYLQAWQHRRKLRDGRKLLPWLRRICRNRALDLRRASWATRIRVSTDTVESMAAKSGVAADQRELLEGLPDALKACVRLRFVDGMGYSQIAQSQCLPLSTIRGRIYLARQRLRKEIEMTSRHTSPPRDQWDEGVLRASPDRVIRWRGMKMKMLCTWRPGATTFHSPSGHRLPRPPAAVRSSRIMSEWKTVPGIDPARHVVLFFAKSGSPGYGFVEGLKTCGEPSSHGRLLLSSIVPAPLIGQQRRRITGRLIGDVVADESAAARLESDFAGICSKAIPGWGTIFAFPVLGGKRRGTCVLEVAYSSSKALADWGLRAVLDDGSEIFPASIDQAGADCHEGNLWGISAKFEVLASRIRGLVLRPRWHATVEWGTIHIPPRE